MNKTDRLAMIRNRYAEKFGVQLASGLLPVTKTEIREEAKAAKIRSVLSGDDSLATGDETEIGSQLVFDKAEVKAERETDILLSPEEKREISKVILAKKRVEIPVVSEDSDRVMLTQDDLPEPILSRELAAEVSPFAELWAAFELRAMADAAVPKLMA
jgi:hypothetical protein